MYSSLLWEYFVKAEGGTASCKKCLKNFQTKSGNTSSLRKHLQSMHKEQYVKIVEEEKVRKEKSEEEKTRKVTILLVLIKVHQKPSSPGLNI